MVPPSGPHGFRPVGFFVVSSMTTVSFYIDGFNLYHSLLRFNCNKVKWLDLAALCSRLIAPKSEKIVSIYYFSAYAYWLPGSVARHKTYVKALEARNIKTIIGNFKNKDRKCFICKATWVAHEEKETDVSIGITMLNDAYKNKYDKALLVTRDSDLVPAVKMIRSEFPNKHISVVAPPMMGHSNDLIKICHSKKKINTQQIWDCLLPELIHDKNGDIIARRPVEYS